MPEVFSAIEADAYIEVPESGELAAVGFIQNINIDVLREVTTRRRVGKLVKTLYITQENYEVSIGALHCDQRFLALFVWRVLFGRVRFGEAKFGAFSSARKYNIRIIFNDEATGQREEYVLRDVQIKEYSLSAQDGELVIETIKAVARGFM